MKLQTSLILAAVLAAPLIGLGQTTVLNDSFSSDLLNPGSYTNPTSSSTTWDTIGNKTTVTASLSSGLNLGTASTGSVVEAAGLFTTSPISLTHAGDYVTLTYTFSGTGIATSNGYLLTGLFNSNGSTPLAGLTNYTTAGGVAGGVTGWTGYNAGLGVVSGSSSSKVFARPSESLATNNQDLLYGGLGTAYASPAQITMTNSTKAALADSTTYTFSYTVSLDSSLNDLISYSLYSGSSATGTALVTNTSTATAGTVTTVFDGLALGFYNKASTATTLTYSNVKVSTNVSAVPEPSTYALIAGVIMLAGAAVRRRLA